MPDGPSWEPYLPPARSYGRPRKTDLREVVNAIFYRNRNGCTWRASPRVCRDFPPWSSSLLAPPPRPPCALPAPPPPPPVDTLGLLLAVTVTAASADDGRAAPQVLAKLTRESFPRLKKLWADNKYHNHALDGWVSEHGWYVIEVKSRPPGSRASR